MFFLLSLLLLVLIFNNNINESVQINPSILPMQFSTDFTTLLMTIYCVNCEPTKDPSLGYILLDMFSGDTGIEAHPVSTATMIELSWGNPTSFQTNYENTQNLSLAFMLNNITTTLLNQYGYTSVTLGYSEDVLLACTYDSICGGWNETVSLPFYNISTLSISNLSSLTYIMQLYISGDSDICSLVKSDVIEALILDTLFPNRNSSLEDRSTCSTSGSKYYYQWERSIEYNSTDFYVYDGQYYNNFYNKTYMADSIKYNLEKSNASLTYLQVFLSNYVTAYCNTSDYCFTGQVSSSGYSYLGFTNFNFTTTMPPTNSPTQSPITNTTDSSSNSSRINIKSYHWNLLFVIILSFIL